MNRYPPNQPRVCEWRRNGRLVVVWHKGKRVEKGSLAIVSLPESLSALEWDGETWRPTDLPHAEAIAPFLRMVWDEKLNRHDDSQDPWMLACFSDSSLLENALGLRQTWDEIRQ